MNNTQAASLPVGIRDRVDEYRGIGGCVNGGRVYVPWVHVLVLYGNYRQFNYCIGLYGSMLLDHGQVFVFS